MSAKGDCKTIIQFNHSEVHSSERLVASLSRVAEAGSWLRWNVHDASSAQVLLPTSTEQCNLALCFLAPLTVPFLAAGRCARVTLEKKGVSPERCNACLQARREEVNQYKHMARQGREKERKKYAQTGSLVLTSPHPPRMVRVNPNCSPLNRVSASGAAISLTTRVHAIGRADKTHGL